jgi:hypothetical protein
VFNYCPERAAFTMQRCLLKLAIIDVRAARCKKQKDSYAPLQLVGFASAGMPATSCGKDSNDY